MRHFVDDRHNLYVGWVLGIAGMKHGLPLAPVIDSYGNYTDRLVLTLPTGDSITLIIPPPPPEWTLA